jgi:radical SAM superfamily enzyme YgiQ (UPF0313 family)
MRVLLVSANTESINMPVIPVGLAAVAAATRNAGHRVELIDLLSVKDAGSAIKEAVEGFQPEVIGISIRNIDDQNMAPPNLLLDQVKPVMSECRRFSEAPIVLGGAGYSIFPESVLSYLGADMGIQGEGEIAFPALLAFMERKADPSGTPGLFLPERGLQCKRNFVKDLDLLPLPDSSLWSKMVAGNQDLWMPIQTRRGCPMRCSYCSTSLIEGRIIRKHTAETVVNLLARHVENGFRRFFFTDNIFNIPLSYAKELSQRLTQRRLAISWRCILYPGYVDESLVRDMAKAGCKEVSLGFESGSEIILRNMNKKFGLENIRRTSELLADYGIGRMGFLLLGGPGESKGSVEESFTFVDSLNLDAIKVTIGIRIYPGTALAKQAVSEGVIAAEDDLLYPKFYLAPEIKGWLQEIVNGRMKDRPHWRM